MKMKPIAMAAISGLVIALAGMPAMADDNTSDTTSAGQLMQSDSSSTDNSQSTTDNSQSQSTQSNSGGSSQGDTSTGGSNTDEGNPDTPSGDDY